VSDEQRILDVATLLAAQPLSAVERHLGGGNNRLFRARTAEGLSFALKEYPRRTNDPRDRLSVEYGALEFLSPHRSISVPRAIAADRDNGFALYEWIDGGPVSAPGDKDVDAALAFAANLHAIRYAPGAEKLPLASEACLSGAEIVAQIGRRHERFKLIAQSEPQLGHFLAADFGPTSEAIEAWSRAGYKALGWSFDAPIGREQQSLSPSDFGFHNAIRRPEGDLVFVDFEYFGWDDPVKLASDFLQHPGMALSPSQYERFRAGAVGIYGKEAAFAQRLALLYPLYGLRWCMILLNEFLPERWESRRLAGVHVDREAATSAQLEKARHRIAAVRQYMTDQAR
jgi:hypothetical protein